MTARREFFSPERLFATDVAPDQFGPPEILEIEPIHHCNFRCVMCHVSYERVTKAAVNVDALRRSIESAPWLRGKWAVVGAAYEPMMHPRFPEIVELLTEAGMKIDLTTNGSLFTDKMIDRIKNGNFAQVTVSFDGARKATYETVRRLADYDRTLERIAAFRHAVGNERTYYAANYTMLRSNLAEIAEAVDLWDGMGFDHVGFIAMVLRDDNETLRAEAIDSVMDEVRRRLIEAATRVVEERTKVSISSAALRFPEVRERWPRNVFGHVVISDNPDSVFPTNCRPHFQEGTHPDVHVACRSPYKHVRIIFDGDVMLCNKFVVGNIKEGTLGEIWEGETAGHVRAKIKDSADVCHACDFYKFCIKASSIDFSDGDNWTNERLRFERTARSAK